MAQAFYKPKWLDGATAVTVTAAEEIGPYTRLTGHISVTGSPTGATVAVEGSIDGENWFSVLTLEWTAAITVTAPRDTDYTGVDQRLVEAACVKYLRLNFNYIAGGTNPTVTVSVMGY